MSIQTRIVISPGYIVPRISCGMLGKITTVIMSSNIAHESNSLFIMAVLSSGQNLQMNFKNTGEIIDYCQNHQNDEFSNISLQFAAVANDLRQKMSFHDNKIQLADMMILLLDDGDSIGSDGEHFFTLSNFSISIIGYGSLDLNEQKILFDCLENECRIGEIIDDIDRILFSNNDNSILVNPMPNNCKNKISQSGRDWYIAISTDL